MAVAELTFGREELAAAQEESQSAMVWRRFRRHKLAVVGLTIATALTLFCFIGPLVSPYAANKIETGSAAYKGLNRLSPGSAITLVWNRRNPATPGDDRIEKVIPGWVAATDPATEVEHRLYLLGTDNSGRDTLTRIMQGGRVSLSLALVVVLVSQFIGTLIGATSAFYGGWVDSVVMRAVDFLLTLPSLPIFMALTVILRDRGIPGGSIGVLALVFIVLGWTGSARLVRGMVLSLKNQEFTEAARAMGASDTRIVLRHLIPNALAPVLVSATLALGGVVVGEASLSYLGFGVQPPDPSWGNMLTNAQQMMMDQPWAVFYPGMAIFLTSLSFNFMGDALRDALDPRGQIK